MSLLKGSLKPYLTLIVMMAAIMSVSLFIAAPKSVGTLEPVCPSIESVCPGPTETPCPSEAQPPCRGPERSENRPLDARAEVERVSILNIMRAMSQ